MSVRSLSVTDLLARTLENGYKDMLRACIKETALRHNFDAELELKELGLEVKLIRKAMTKKGSGVTKKSKKEKKEKSFPLPFSGKVDSCCFGLNYNHGLFTQCENEKMDNGEFCVKCQKEADNSTTGKPISGTVSDRLEKDVCSYSDSKGRKVVPYVKVLEKLKLSKEEALEAGKKANREIDGVHWIVEKKEKKEKKVVRGRPKKESAVVEVDSVADLFAKLTVEGEEEESNEVEDKKQKKVKLSDEEKAVKKAALEEERIAKKAEREAKLLEEKAEREAKRKEELEKKKAEREAKIAEEKAAREAKIAEEKAAREAKRAEEKAAKAKTTNGKKVEEKEVKKDEKEVKKEEKEVKKVTVSRRTIDGKEYLVSGDNIVYDPKTKEAVGLWDPESKSLKDLPEDDEEEEEEDYEDEDEDDEI